MKRFLAFTRTGLLLVPLTELHAASPGDLRFALNVDGASVVNQTTKQTI